MELIKSKHYLVKTDWEILNDFVNELKELGITKFDQLAVKLKELNIKNFDELLKYISGSQCNDDLAILAEGLLERIRAAVPDRDLIMQNIY